MSKIKKTPKTKSLDIADATGLAMLAPARSAAERMGLNAYTMALCNKMGVEANPNRVSQVRIWLGLEPKQWKHPRAGVAKMMLEIK